MDYRERCYRAFVSKHWNYVHVFSEKEYEFHARLYQRIFRRWLPADKQANILDVACGAGHFLFFLKKAGYQRISGIDVSGEQIAMARKMGIPEVRKADLFAFLARARPAYDFIVANDIIEHLTKDEILKFLDLVFGALKPGGRLLVSTENAASMFGAGRVFIDFTHEIGFTPTSLSQVLRVCDFEDIQLRGVGPVLHDLTSLLRIILWKGLSFCLKGLLIIECGLGRGLQKRPVIFEPRLMALGTKPFPEVHPSPAGRA